MSKYLTLYVLWKEVGPGTPDRVLSIHHVVSGPLHLLRPLSAGVSPDVLKAGSFSAQTSSLMIKSNVLSAAQPRPHVLFPSQNSSLPETALSIQEFIYLISVCSVGG